MQQALELAVKADGLTSPNPMVGCVIVKNDRVVGRGYHHGAGKPHAEREALKEAGEEARGATLYVTLEPCNHYGRTPPCTHAITEAGIKNVVYAVADPNPIAQGGGDWLSANNINVTSGVLADEATHQNRFFFHHQKTRLPYIIAKYATSLDGRIATRTGHSQWITGSTARQKGHSLRQSVDAIVVGAQTVIDDNPSLTTRLNTSAQTIDATRPSHPLRVVLDSSGRIPLTARCLSGALEGHTLVATTDAMPAPRQQSLRDSGVDVLVLPRLEDTGFIDLRSLLVALGQRDIMSAMVEGGRAVLGSFMDHRLIDEVWAFIAPMLIGGTDSLMPIGGCGIDRLNEAPRITTAFTEKLGDDFLIAGRLAYPQESV